MDFSEQTLEEAISMFGQFCAGGSYAFSNLFNSDGAYWNVVYGNGGAAGGFLTLYNWLNTQYFNRIQRYAARYTFISNAYAATAVNALTILTLGNGFEYVSSDESIQKKLDEWLNVNKWSKRSVEAYKNWLVDGEVFLRVFDGEVRFVDPDLVYSERGARDEYLGVVYDDMDYEQVKGYLVHRSTTEAAVQGTFVPSSELQHRKNSQWNMKRGLSWLLPVLSDLFEADKLTNSLMSTADVRAKFALIRQHQANQDAVTTFRSGIQNQPQNQWAKQALGQNGTCEVPPLENIENYPAGSILDAANTVEYKTLDGPDTDKYIPILQACLRKIAAHFHLPMSIFSNNGDERGAYASEMVHGSYVVRQIEALQQQLICWDLELMELCGIDTNTVQVTTPEVSLPDKRSQTMLAEFLIKNHMCSKQTLGKMFEIDYESEVDLIKQEIEIDNMLNSLRTTADKTNDEELAVAEDQGVGGGPEDGKEATNTGDMVDEGDREKDIRGQEGMSIGD